MTRTWSPSLWGRVEYRLNNGGTFGAPVRIYAVPSGGGGRAVSVGDADGDGDLDVYALISNVHAGTNPNDVLLRNNALTLHPGAGAAARRASATPLPPWTATPTGAASSWSSTAWRPAVRPNASSSDSSDAPRMRRHSSTMVSEPTRPPYHRLLGGLGSDCSTVGCAAC